MSGRLEGCTNGQTDRCTDGLKNKDGCMDMDGGMDMDGCIDVGGCSRKDAGIDGCMGGWMQREVHG